MIIQGNLTDSSTGKPIPGALFKLYLDGNSQGPPADTFVAGPDGSYSYSNNAIDTASNPAFFVSAPGYEELVGSPGFFDGANTLDPIQVVTNKIPGWVWIAVGIAVILGFIYVNKKYKLTSHLKNL